MLVQPAVEIAKPSVDEVKAAQLVSSYCLSSCVSWWVQVVLTAISAGTLSFVNTVRQGGFRDASTWTSGFACSAISTALGLLSIIWTWISAGSSKRWQTADPVKTASKLRLYSQVAIFISLLGMFVSIIGAEQMTGSLVVQALSSQTLGGLLSANSMVNPFQPMDIFLVQANTNAMLSHFAALVCFVLMLRQLQ